MLKPIHRVNCFPALQACQNLMQRFALWLCHHNTTVANLTQAGLRPPVMPSVIEADWLWDYLQSKKDRRQLLECALVLVAMPNGQKTALSDWVKSVSELTSQFQPGPPAWPVAVPLANTANWAAFKTLMEEFYEKGFRTGLPYSATGSPVSTGGVTHADFVSAFRDKHRLNSDPNAREVCVFCGGLLGAKPHVDHWIIKSAFPLLSVSADNLTLICSDCNEAPNKGEKLVHSEGGFANWFHPYLRPANGAIRLDYDFHAAAVNCRAVTPADTLKVEKLDRLLNLASRWTVEFKAEYAKQQSILRNQEARRIRAAQARHTAQELQQHVQLWTDELVDTEPNYEVHALLARAMNEPARMQAWLAELATVQ